MQMIHHLMRIAIHFGGQYFCMIRLGKSYLNFHTLAVINIPVYTASITLMSSLFFSYTGWIVMIIASFGALFSSFIAIVYGNVVCALAPIIIATTEVNYRIGYLAL